jgi:hypothetical protein
MIRHHENPPPFREAVRLTQLRYGVTSGLIEKDFAEFDLERAFQIVAAMASRVA